MRRRDAKRKVEVDDMRMAWGRLCTCLLEGKCS